MADQVDPARELPIRENATSVLSARDLAIFTFNNVQVRGDTEADKIRGTINAKNGFGAYTGKQFFFAGYLHQAGVYEVLIFNVPGYSRELAIANGRICD